MTEAEHFDVAVIGGGPAGAAAAIASARQGATTALFEPMAVGGEAMNIPAVTELPDQEPVAGQDFVVTLTERVMKHPIDLRFGDTVTSLEPEASRWRIEAEMGSVLARAVILCTGAGHVPLPGRPDGDDDPLYGSGLFTCASCDAPLYAGKRVAVAGGGDTGADAAAQLSEYAAQVLVFEREASLTCQPGLRGRLSELGNVELRLGTEVLAAVGNGSLAAVRVRANGGESDETVDGLMLAVGMRPRSELVAGHAELGDDGAVVVGPDLATSAPGLYAAGDVRVGSPYRCGAAWGDGLTAAAAALRRLGAPQRTGP